MEQEISSTSVPRVAAVHDLSGFGRSSLTIVLPVLAVMGIQTCPLPTAVLSTQTSGFTDYSFHDLTQSMKDMIAHWKKLGLRFDGFYSGFLGSYPQIEVVSSFIDRCREHSHIPVLVDPVLGDDGKTYGTITGKLVAGMKKLIGKATIITPNYTEAALLLGEPFRKQLSTGAIKAHLTALAELGPEKVIITSVPAEGRTNFNSVYAYNSNDATFWKVECEYLPASYPGTGDMFASVIIGSLLNGDSFPESIDRAVQFVYKAIRTTYGKGIPVREGVLLERVLNTLSESVPIHTYEMVK